MHPRGLLEFGYVEGQNIMLEYRSSEGKDHQFFDFAAELVRLKVDVIVTGGSTPATVAAKNVTACDHFPCLTKRRDTVGELSSTARNL